MLGFSRNQNQRDTFDLTSLGAHAATVDEAAPSPAPSHPVTRFPGSGITRLDPAFVGRTHESFSTRRVPKSEMKTLVTGAVRVRSGDVVLARVDRLRQHSRLELPSGRKANLRAGQDIIVACGNRYASDQFEAFVPEGLGSTNLVASGGIAGTMTARARGIVPATEITLLGMIGDDQGTPINLRKYALPAILPGVHARPHTIGVFGTSMNSGKTTTAEALVRGLLAAGLRVGYAKVTGTGSGGDYWSMVDCGATAVVDFTDAGYASTYMTAIPAIEKLSIQLLGHLSAEGCQVVVVEVADGILQRETAALLRSDTFKSLLDRVVFAAGDPLAAAAGVTSLKSHGFDVAAVSGLVTASPLPLREAREVVEVDVLTRDQLEMPTMALPIVRMSSDFGSPALVAMEAWENYAPGDVSYGRVSNG